MWLMLEYAESFVAILRDLSIFFTSSYMTVPVLNINDWSWYFVDIPLPFGFTVAEIVIGGGLTIVLGTRLLKFSMSSIG